MVEDFTLFHLVYTEVDLVKAPNYTLKIYEVIIYQYIIYIHILARSLTCENVTKLIPAVAKQHLAESPVGRHVQCMSNVPGLHQSSYSLLNPLQRLNFS